MSNFQETQAQFDGTFYETLDMATIGDGHVASEDMEVRQFLSQGNFGESNEFLGTIHTSLHVKDGTFVNLVNSQAVMVPLAQVRDQLLAQWTGPQPEDIVIVVSDEMGYEGRALKENVIVLPIGALLDIAFGLPGEGVDGTEQGVDPKVAALDRELAEKYGLNLAVVAEEGEPPQPSTQSELAAFMAHELSHILLGHYQRGDGAVERERINNSMTGLTYVGIALGGARVDKVNDQYEVNIHNEARSSDLLKNAMIASAVAQESNRLLNASASREQEDHADLLAVDLVSLANYNPAGVKAFLGRETVAAAQAEFRVEDMSEAQTMLASQLATSLGAGQGNFLNDMAATFAVSGFQNVMNRMSSTHRSNEKRLENVTNYLIRLENDMFGLDKDGQPIENPELVSAFTERVAGAKYLEDAQVPSAQLEALRNPEGEAFRVLKAYNDTREAKRLLAEPDKEENVERAGELLRKARLGAGKLRL
ncbi:MAG: M48 family metalloprotease [Pseudomonadota bacterium]